MSDFEWFRKELFTLLNAAIAAEREECAKLSENQPWSRGTGKRIAQMIRARPLFRLPPISLEMLRRRKSPLIARKERR